MSDLSREEKDLLIRVQEKPELQGYFFKKIKSLKWFDDLYQSGLLGAENIPRPVENENGTFSIQYWTALDYLVESAKKIPAEFTNDFGEKYLELIRNYTGYCQREGFSNYRVWWRMSEVLHYLPLDIIRDEDISMIDFWLEDRFDGGLTSDELVKLLLFWLDNYQERHFEKCYLLLQMLFKVEEVVSRRSTKTGKEAVLSFKSYRTDEYIRVVSAKAGSVLGDKALRFFMGQLVKVVDIRGGDEYSHIWRSAIEDHEQNMSVNDAEDYFILALREAVIALEEDCPGAAGELVAELIAADKNILKRIGIYCINHFFDTYQNDLFNQILVGDSFRTILKHEMWELVKNNFQKFSEKQCEDFFQFVDDLKHYKETDRPDLYHQAEWLAAIKDISGRAKERYESIVKEIGVEPEHPGFSSYFSSGSFGREDESPIPLEELKAIENRKDLVQLLNDFPIESDFGEPGIEGLAGCFKAYVLSEEEDGNEFFNDLDELTGLHAHFLHELIDAYRQMWREPEKSTLDWNAAWPKLVTFIAAIVCRDSFWEMDVDVGDAFIGRRPWVVSGICSLFEAGCKKDDDERSFTLEYAAQVKRILEVILDHQSPIEFDENYGAVTAAINSPRGNALEALINLALFESRAAIAKAEPHDVVWEIYEPIFDKEFEVENNVEFYTLVPLYISNFYYLSNAWMDAHFDFFFNPEDRVKWLCALEGFSSNNSLHPRIFEFLKKEGMYERVLEDDLNSHVDKRYVDYGLIPYIRGEEELGDENSLIERLISRNDLEELRQLIWFFGFNLKKNKGIQLKVLELLPRILSVIEFETIEGRKLASYLLHWAEFIDELNEQTVDWLKAIVPYAEFDYNSSEIMGAFAKWSENYPDQVCELWFEMLQENPGFPYPEESFKTAYKNLLKAGFVRQAKDISGGYLKYNIDAPVRWLQEVQKELDDV